MPLEIDPHWEYHVVDPEVEELFTYTSTKIDDLFDSRLLKTKRLGLRFGNGRWDKFSGRLAPPKPQRVIDNPVTQMCCVSCGTTFLPDRHGRTYCSRFCVVHPGRARKLSNIPCQRCNKVFRPHWHGHIFCSMSCSNKAKGTSLKTMPPEGFKEMYEEGATLNEIMTKFGVQKACLKVWRRKLNLEARPPGNYSRVKK